MAVDTLNCFFYHTCLTRHRLVFVLAPPMSPLELCTTFSSHFYSYFSTHVVLGPENRANSRESRASVDSATMENNYGIGVSNKFALFLDEEGEEADVENLLIINAKKVQFPVTIHTHFNLSSST